MLLADSYVHYCLMSWLIHAEFRGRKREKRIGHTVGWRERQEDGCKLFWLLTWRALILHSLCNSELESCSCSSTNSLSRCQILDSFYSHFRNIKDRSLSFFLHLMGLCCLQGKANMPKQYLPLLGQPIALYR